MPYYVYIMANDPNGTIYTGMTNNLARRAYEHREGLCHGFTKKYSLGRLVWYEEHESPGSAIRREKNLKGWSREWKVKLIETLNPRWDDLYQGIL